MKYNLNLVELTLYWKCIVSKSALSLNLHSFEVRFEDFSVTPSEVSGRAGLASVSVQLLRQVEPICFDVLVDPVHDTVTSHP
jgi:hypothetical protein